MKFKRGVVIVLLIISILLSIRLVNNYFNNAAIKKSKEKTVETLNEKFDNEVKQPQNSESVNSRSKENNEGSKKVKNVVGKIVIEKLGISYPILEGSTEENLSISITRFYGSQVNSIGNCVLAGHNMKDGSLFGRLSELSEDDNIILYDNSGNRKKYKVFNIKVVDPKDLSVLSQDTNNSCWVTLITCSNNGKNRLIIQANEV